MDQTDCPSSAYVLLALRWHICLQTLAAFARRMLQLERAGAGEARVHAHALELYALAGFTALTADLPAGSDGPDPATPGDDTHLEFLRFAAASLLALAIMARRVRARLVPKGLTRFVRAAGDWEFAAMPIAAAPFIAPAYLDSS